MACCLFLSAKQVVGMAQWWEKEFATIEGEYYAQIEPASVNDILFGSELDTDARAQGLFMEAFFNDNEQAYADLIDYLWDEYGIDFEDAFDWADFREWYG